MLFTSLSFYVFFPLVTLGYFLLPHRWRWLWLLAASAYFYMAFIPAYILILLFTILVNYFSGIAIEEAGGKRRRLFLIASLLANVGTLGFFKYFNFFSANVSALANWLGWNLPLPLLAIILPIGLSFYTFQSMAYTIEVYRGNQKAERHPGLLALYVMFYPQLVAGPIERPGRMLPQFREEHRFNYSDAADGLRLMAWGFFKKLVIADRLALLVNPVYAAPQLFTGPLLLLGTLAFTYQLYCDFSGYTDIAIGAARVMGFRMMANFDRPYSARSISDFWQRWHISLSSWFRDYIFYPLRRSLLRRKARLPDWLNQFLPAMTTMLLSGLWHGASWNFVFWGGLHGLYLTFEQWSAGLRVSVTRKIGLDRAPRLHRFLQTAVVFLLVSFSFIFFRARSINDAFYIGTNLFQGYELSQIPLWLEQIRISLGENFPLTILFTSLTGGHILVIVLLQIAFLEVVQILQKGNPVEQILTGQSAVFRWSVYYFLLVNILLFGAFQQTTFIYFQF